MENQNQPALQAMDPALEASEIVNKNILLFTVSFTLFFMSYMYQSVNIALPAISRDFHAHVIDLSWVTSTIFLTTAILLVPFGRLADIVGLKRMYIIGMVLFVITNTIAALSSSVAMLITMRAMQGISASMVVGNTIALISAAFPAGEKGKAIGIASSAVYVGQTSSPLISGFLTEHWGWRSLFLFTVPAGIIVLLLIFWKIKGEWRGSRGERLDLLGTVIFGISVISLMYGFSRLSDIRGWILIPIGIFVMLGFIIWESRVKSPLVKIDLFRRNRVFVLSNICAMINYSATYGIVFFMSLYLQYVKGLNPGTAGLVMAIQPATQAVLSPMAGKISDKVEPRVVVSLGMAITCICLASFGLLRQETPMVIIMTTLLMFGVGFALFVSPNTNAVMSSVPTPVYGVASAIMNTMRNFGQMFSMGIAMMVLALVMGSVVVSKTNIAEFVASTRIAFLAFALLCLIGVIASLSRGKVR